MRKVLLGIVGGIFAVGLSTTAADWAMAQPKEKAAAKTACPPDQRYSRKEKGCVARCQPPRIYNTKTRRCRCPEGQVYKRRAKQCVAVPAKRTKAKTK